MLQRKGPIRLHLLVTGAILLLAAVECRAAEEGKRFALVIGNSNYPTSPLRNPVNDAAAMEKVLKDADFQIFPVKNGSKEAMYKAVGDFTQSLGPEDTALVFFAGHAVQIEGENVLIPVDFAAANTLFEAKSMMVSLGAIMDELKRRRPKRTIIIIDACRVNPVTQKYDLPVGLAEPMNMGNETYVAFSTSLGKTAKDNPEGTNSWFTEALTELIPEPQLPLDELFTRVRSRVKSETGGDQVPESRNKLTSIFYFHPPKGGGTDEDAQMRQKRMLEAERHEKWGDWAEAMAVMNRLAGQGSDDLAKRAAARMPYLAARKKAAELFEQRDFAGAAEAYNQALQQDPFAMDAALEAVNSYLLCDRLPDAVRVLKEMRLRGTSQTLDTVDAMLQQLSPVNVEARKEAESPRPDPVPIQQIFRNARFGAPDFDAGKRYAQGNPVDLTKAFQNLAAQAVVPTAVAQTAEPIAPATAQTTEPTAQVQAQQGPVTIEGFHVEVSAVAGDRVIGIAPAKGEMNTSGVTRPSAVQVKVTTDPPGMNLMVEDDREQQCPSPCVLWLTPGSHQVQAAHDGYRTEHRAITVPAAGGSVEIHMQPEFGFVKLTGPQRTATVLINGKQVAQQLPFNMQLPTGTYRIRMLQDGKELKSGEIAVKAGEVMEVPFEKE